jgi:hypothetical protein
VRRKDGGYEPIPDEEWLRIVADSADLELVGEVTATSPKGEVVRYRNPLLAEWTQHPDPELRPPFDFRRGQVVVKNPDDPVVARLAALARALSAQVIDDDGQVYDNPGGAPLPASASSAPPPNPRRRWLRR